jgi:hypothetical protein
MLNWNEGNDVLGRRRRRWEDNIKTDVTDMVWTGFK